MVEVKHRIYAIFIRCLVQANPNKVVVLVTVVAVAFLVISLSFPQYLEVI